MLLGVHCANLTWPGGPDVLGTTLAGVARAADEGGATTLTMMDHYFQMEQFAPAEQPMLEGYTSLAFMAAHTSNIRLGLIVTGVTYRSPGLLAKIVTTLDVLSGGRAQLGIGAAWYEREHLGLGVPYPPVAERFERLEETLQICLQMWSDENGPYQGKHYQLAETLCSPRPIQQPRPPILIGGSGERKTLRLVARYADRCNLFATGHDEIARKLDVLRRHCDDENRDYSTIDPTIIAMGDPLGDPEAFLTQMAGYAELGISTAVIAPRGDPVEFVHRMADRVLPAMAALENPS
jgi:F420-dependent oxidoreductase-like protein